MGEKRGRSGWWEPSSNRHLFFFGRSSTPSFFQMTVCARGCNNGAQMNTVACAACEQRHACLADCRAGPRGAVCLVDVTHRFFGNPPIHLPPPFLSFLSASSRRVRACAFPASALSTLPCTITCNRTSAHLSPSQNCPPRASPSSFSSSPRAPPCPRPNSH